MIDATNDYYISEMQEISPGQQSRSEHGRVFERRHQEPDEQKKKRQRPKKQDITPESGEIVDITI